MFEGGDTGKTSLCSAVTEFYHGLLKGGLHIIERSKLLMDNSNDLPINQIEIEI